jgi:uncharacterized DUF497 family protein
MADQKPFGRIGSFEWDDNKRKQNVTKHGIDFDTAKEVFSDPAAYTLASPASAEEQRYVTVGIVRGVVIAVISTMRESALRIISARVARRNERQRYGSEVQKPERE